MNFSHFMRFTQSIGSLDPILAHRDWMMITFSPKDTTAHARGAVCGGPGQAMQSSYYVESLVQG
jgi:hypothetical protein